MADASEARKKVCFRRVLTMEEESMRPVHPGKILLKEFIKPTGISQTQLANFINVPPRRINEIVLGKRRISADTALRLGRYFGTSPHFWLGLQTDYDICIARSRIGDSLKRDILAYAM
jgi:addiction module HigA family antidote